MRLEPMAATTGIAVRNTATSRAAPAFWGGLPTPEYPPLGDGQRSMTAVLYMR